MDFPTVMCQNLSHAI